MTAPRRPHEQGSATLEVAIVTPALLLFMLLVVFGGRLALAHGEADSAARDAEMEAPMPGQAVLEAVIAGERRFTKAQLEFSLSEAIVLTNWEMTPLELMEKGEPWVAALILKNHATASD